MNARPNPPPEQKRPCTHPLGLRTRLVGSCAGIFALTLAGFLGMSWSDGRPAMALFRGACDASAVESVDAERLVVACDEDNVLRVYRRADGGPPEFELDLSRFLAVDPRQPESDLEAAARIGDRIYWISSHGRNRRGAARPSRQRFFATALTGDEAQPLAPVGRSCDRLVEQLLRDPRFQPYRLASASRRAPKSPGALNIEGLAALPDGGLLIGFRNPIPQRQALLVPLENPGEVVTGGLPRFGDPRLLDLGGLGIRSLANWQDGFVILAGSADGSGRSHLFRWNGRDRQAQRLDQPSFSGFNPEGLAFFAGSGGWEFLVVSDDGTRSVAGQPCKKLADSDRRMFRALTFPARLLDLP